MLMLKKNSQRESDAKAIFEQKLYIAKESPEPIFDLSDCQLRHVPSGIYSLCKVFRKECLYLQNNKLSTLEDGGHLEDLYLLKVLNISESPVGSENQIAAALQSPFDRQPLYSWEEQEAEMVEQERRLHEASIQQREKFLTEVLKDQSELDAEIAKVQEIREAERQQLIKSIQHDEKQVQFLLNNFIQSQNMNPEVVQQQLEYEQAEHDRLLEISRQNYNNVRKFDILKAMEDLIDEDRAIQSSKQKYDAYLNSVKDNMMLQELECSEKLEELLKAKDETREFLVQQLLEDHDIQKAMVASLLERVDAKSWSLNQEIAIVTSNLAKLSVIEQEKQKLHLTYNYNQLLDQRVQLLTVLDDLLEQQNKRRVQLVETLKEMEQEQTENMTDFWLKNYQKLIESAPKSLLDTGKNLDPQFANFLLQEGVIHCLPFLVKFIFSDELLINITSEKLRESGVSLSTDRESILRAIENYLSMKSKLSISEIQYKSVEPSAPVEDAIEEHNQGAVVDINADDSSVMASECVICMDAKCEVVLVPCGHMCCCYICSEKGLLNCPMCRVDIEKRIRVMIP
ncbi:E3 ubiquitin-protein ligase LRSAM1 [Eumeta japonica]|uniref:E3 ubiquitin-protein ligase LRSAM1 n=1 Tax=Eumeta variegata TaxID=151549 RepID=A0A4C1TF51_EUMVA|nr:E3 ubiquitin-protein ligase LRSAM1 [Eumeta japonica]